MDIYQKLKADLPVDDQTLQAAADMSAYSSFRLGGPADCLFFPRTSEEIRLAGRLARQEELELTLLGRCSNVVIADAGIRGLTILLADNFAQVEIEGQKIVAQSGASLAAVAGQAANRGLSGLEFAAGIPGAVGGGVMMNAGAYDGCLADLVLWSEFLDEEGNLHRISGPEHGFAYRTSIFSGSKLTILRTAFALKEGHKPEIMAKISDFAQRRRQSQPLDKPSAGSAFKRPPGYFAGKLISDCGLKGYRSGGAAVSEKHAGFIVNLDHAKAADVLAVFCHVQATVRREKGVLLEPEVRFAGDWSQELSQLQACHII